MVTKRMLIKPYFHLVKILGVLNIASFIESGELKGSHCQMNQYAKYRSRLLGQVYPQHLIFSINSTFTSIIEFRITHGKQFCVTKAPPGPFQDRGGLGKKGHNMANSRKNIIISCCKYLHSWPFKSLKCAEIDVKFICFQLREDGKKG